MMYKNRIYNGLSEYNIVCNGIYKNMIDRNRIYNDLWEHNL